MTDDARRRRCDPMETCVVDRGARLGISGMFRRIGIREVRDGSYEVVKRLVLI